MNKIEELFFSSLQSIVLSDTEKIMVLDSCEEIKYQFSEAKFLNWRKLSIVRPETPKSDFVINTQFKIITNEDNDCEIKGYIPDFIIDLGGGGYAIEIDGYEWHEKTKEQAINDRKKDRAYIKHGYIPVRFLGSEVYHDSKKCAEEFIELLIENELAIFWRDSIMNIDIAKCNLELENKKLCESVYGIGTVSPLFIKEHKIIVNPIEYITNLKSHESEVM